jgi:NADH dehydrogenase [ubiquinone] 1 alpha subcomplex assembly factor 7
MTGFAEGRVTGLAGVLAARIAATGPISVAEFMAAVLTDPARGYYRSGDPLGAGGDFTTAPEISQLFGELIGAWLIDCWNQAGRPKPVRLVELGPGRGTLMQDALRAGRILPEWLEAVELHLVEINPALRGLQGERLAPYQPQWHDALDSVPDGPVLLVANEFLDALPIRQLMFAGNTWRERLIAWSERSGFHFTLSATPSPLAALVPPDLSGGAEGSLVELSPAAIGIATEAARRISAFGGAALLIDYGRMEPSTGESLQAVKEHRPVGIFDAPGTADLSAHVDFGTLSRAASEAGATTFGPVTQGDFLAELGITLRADRLKRDADPTEAGRIDEAVERLVGSDAMGSLFKALAIAQSGVHPAGFAAGRR